MTADTKPTWTCDWCKNTVLDSESVWLELNREDDEFSGVFCGTEHASLWAAKPYETTWQGGQQHWWSSLGCASLLLFVILLLVVGAGTLIGKFLDWIR